jgi:GTP cyclohydrolase IA
MADEAGDAGKLITDDELSEVGHGVSNVFQEETLETALQNVLDVLAVDPDDENFHETPRRFASYLQQHFRPPWQVQEEYRKLSSATFPTEYRGMVVQKGIGVDGMCPHHLLPVAYRVSLAYLPGERVLGLSKLVRLAKLYGELAILQEDATERIVDALERILDTRGAAVVMEGRHSCMAIRGVKEPAVVVTSAVRGTFRESATAKEEFLSLLRLNGQ